MPWSGTTFTWNPLAGWENFLKSLMAPPPSPADGIKVASGLDLSQALAAVLAGLVVDFNLFEPGSPACPGQCALPPELTTEGRVRSILAWSPGNPLITEWLSLVEEGKANGATQAQRDLLIETFAADLGVFKFNPDTMTQINAVLNSINPVLPRIAAHSGLLGQFDPTALLADIANVLGSGAASSATALAGPSTADLLPGTGFQRTAPEARLAAPSTPNSPTPPGTGGALPQVAPADPADPPKTGAPVVSLAVAPPVAAADQPAQPPAGVPRQSTPRQPADMLRAAGGAVLVPGLTPPGLGMTGTKTSAPTSTRTTKDRSWKPWKPNPFRGGAASSSSTATAGGTSATAGGTSATAGGTSATAGGTSATAGGTSATAGGTSATAGGTSATNGDQK